MGRAGVIKAQQAHYEKALKFKANTNFFASSWGHKTTCLFVGTFVKILMDYFPLSFFAGILRDKTTENKIN